VLFYSKSQKVQAYLRYSNFSVVTRSVSRLSHVARHSFCKTFIDRYNTGVLHPHSAQRQTAMRGTLQKVIYLSAWYLRSETRREWEKSARVRKERARGIRAKERPVPPASQSHTRACSTGTFAHVERYIIATIYSDVSTHPQDTYTRGMI